MLANPFHNIGFYHLHSLSFRFGPPQAERQWANRVQSTRSLTPIEARDLRFVAVSIRHRWYERSNVDVWNLYSPLHRSCIPMASSRREHQHILLVLQFETVILTIGVPGS